MTPEEVESRLQSLRTPEPSERLRARCLAARPAAPRPRAAFAVAASFLVAGLSVWLLAMPKAPDRPPDKILPPPSAPGPFGDDPVLKDKVDRLLRDNPGKGVLVVRARRLSEGTVVPVTGGFTMSLQLKNDSGGPEIEGPRAEVDLDGTLLFPMAPGRYRVVAHRRWPTAELKALHFRWDCARLVVESGGVAILPDARFAPYLEWSSPAPGSDVRLSSDPRVAWAPYAGLASVEVTVERPPAAGLDGSWNQLGSIRRDYPRDHFLPLAELLRACPNPARAGETIVLSLRGFGAGGEEVTRTREKLTLRLQE